MECGWVKLSDMGKPVNTRRSAEEPVKGPVDKAMEVLEALVEGAAARTASGTSPGVRA